MVQSLSGTGSLRVGAEFISKFLPGTTVYLSNPTWGNHRNIFADAGVEWKYYRWAQVVAEWGSSAWAASHAVAALARGCLPISRWLPQEVELHRLSWLCWAGRWLLCLLPPKVLVQLLLATDCCLDCILGRHTAGFQRGESRVPLVQHKRDSVLCLAQLTMSQ